MSHSIPLNQAKQMIALYKEQKENILKQEFQGKNLLPLSETYEVADFARLIAEPGCVRLRIYYGMSPDLNVHAIIVAVNQNNEDILPSTTVGVNSATEDDPIIIEDGLRCPPDCPPSSPIAP